ncbi:hypothetical protein [Campylobacter sp. RM15925]|nr:hypothetical protein [Campylobacter sp. RM15925]
MYEFIEVSKMLKFLISFFAPTFSAFVAYKLISLGIDIVRKNLND